jgi:hypothetical protein
VQAFMSLATGANNKPIKFSADDPGSGFIRQ